MQAGDKLTFVEPFDPFLKRPGLEPTEQEEALEEFVLTSKRLLDRFDSSVRSVERLDESGFLTVFELSLKVPAPDDSYLHAVIFGHRDDEGLININLSLIEHDNEAYYRNGYMYTFEDNRILRSSVIADDENEELTDIERKIHFSVFDIYAGRDELTDLELSENEEAIASAKEVRGILDDWIAFDELEKEMGFDALPVTAFEVKQLDALLRDAIAFPHTEFPDAE